MEFVDWFRRDRRRDVLPAGVDVRTLSRSCWAWWLELQPDARGITKQERPSDIPLSEWNKTVRKPTTSGFYLVLVALVWWGTCLFEKDRRETLKEWERLVDDVAWVVESWSAVEGASEDDGEGGSDSGNGSDDGGGNGNNNGNNNGASGTVGRGQKRNGAKTHPKSIDPGPVNKKRTRSTQPSRTTKKRRRRSSYFE